MEVNEYLMESDDEEIRLELKTDKTIVKKQAQWAGINAGMRVADIGCGPGITTNALNDLVRPDGETIGIDFSQKRIEYAQKHYKDKGIEFICRDARESLEDLGKFDFIWVRFLLEYYLDNSFQIVENLAKILKPGGILCLIDLDHNCLSHFGIPERLEKNVFAIMKELQRKANFDPFAGRKLYSYLYDLGFNDIAVDVAAHHNIYGTLKDSDSYNWLKKVEIAPERINYKFNDYNGGREEFIKEFRESFSNQRRYTYTPIILCRGVKPGN